MSRDELGPAADEVQPRRCRTAALAEAGLTSGTLLGESGLDEVVGEEPHPRVVAPIEVCVVDKLLGGLAGREVGLHDAVAVLHTPLILVLGHDGCGAVDATIKSLRDNKPLPGHMPSLVEALAPSVKAVFSRSGNTLANAIRQNVIDNVAKLKSATPILGAAVGEQKVKVAGGIYRLESGKVEMVA